MKNVYLVLAIVGAVVPYFFFIQHFQHAGFGVGDFIAGAFANGAAAGASADLVISSLVFWAYLLSRRAAFSWVYVIINLTIGLSCALPLYLYMMERRQAADTPAAVAG
ncbi:MAG: DUF2834 domain-containing protein [Pseudomonadales bacterium]